eukprot:2630643-Rhodomonas_salina.1
MTLKYVNAKEKNTIKNHEKTVHSPNVHPSACALSPRILFRPAEYEGLAQSQWTPTARQAGTLAGPSDIHDTAAPTSKPAASTGGPALHRALCIIAPHTHIAEQSEASTFQCIVVQSPTPTRAGRCEWLHRWPRKPGPGPFTTNWLFNSPKLLLLRRRTA